MGGFRINEESIREASQTRDYCVAKNATRRAARPDPSLRKERLFRMTIKLHHYQRVGRSVGRQIRVGQRGYAILGMLDDERGDLLDTAEIFNLKILDINPSLEVLFDV